MSDNTHGAVLDTPAEVEVTEAEKAAAEELAAFEAETEGTELPTGEQPKEEAAQTEPSVKTEVQETEPEKSVEPSLAKVTEEQMAALLNTAKTVEELQAGLEKLRGDAFGKLGGLERLLKQAEKSTDSGLDLELTDADFKEVEQEVPFLAKPLQNLITKIVKQAKVKVPGAPSVDLSELNTQFEEKLKTTREAALQEANDHAYKQIQTALVFDKYPDFKETVASKEFETWLMKEDVLTPGYKDMFLGSWNAREIGGVMRKFNAHKEAAEKAKTVTPSKPKTPPASQLRKERLAEAIPPKASSKTPPPKGPMTEQEAFDAE